MFEEESTQVHVVLSDRALSVIEIDSADEIQTTVAQVCLIVSHKPDSVGEIKCAGTIEFST